MFLSVDGDTLAPSNCHHLADKKQHKPLENMGFNVRSPGPCTRNYIPPDVYTKPTPEQFFCACLHAEKFSQNRLFKNRRR